MLIGRAEHFGPKGLHHVVVAAKCGCVDEVSRVGGSGGMAVSPGFILGSACPRSPRRGCATTCRGTNSVVGGVGDARLVQREDEDRNEGVVR